ncbi:hypothetical protein GMST_34130 [Geomonas silvestris]|uniref:HTH cro/C1-type domain-containing protein n=1 Tax=Geomonas silvestris TaxID=2740184 RepID=A0A6V8MM54_9BACT|nr:hypothetical protein GMST_34130 [Geomonas silvestris]
MLDFGKRIRLLRTLRGVSQSELAVLSGQRLDQAVIARHESCAAALPRRHTVEAYAGALRIPHPLLTGRHSAELVLQEIFRPWSPWKRPAPETGNRIVADLQALLPEFVEELALLPTSLLSCALGEVAVLSGGGHRLILVLPLGAARLLGLVPEQGGAEGGISEQHYLLLLLDPAGSLDAPELPGELRLDPKPQVGELYRLPRQSTGVSLELLGDLADIDERLHDCLKGEQLVHLEVRRPDDLKAQLPDQVRDYLNRNRLDLDHDGHLVLAK